MLWDFSRPVITKSAITVFATNFILAIDGSGETPDLNTSGNTGLNGKKPKPTENYNGPTRRPGKTMASDAGKNTGPMGKNPKSTKIFNSPTRRPAKTTGSNTEMNTGSDGKKPKPNQKLNMTGKHS